MTSIRCTARRICFLALTCSVLVVTSPVAGAAARGVSFSVGESVSLNDEQDVREGVQLARDYLKTTLAAEVTGDLIINVRQASDPTNPGLVGFSGGDFIVIYTGSSGWINASPFNRIHVVVHEYLHVYQHDLTGFGDDLLPAWLIEGTADYLAYDAVAEIGLIAPRAVRDYQAWAVAEGPDLSELAAYESLPAFQDAAGPVYNLSYLAVQFLLADLAPEALGRYFAAINDGFDWQPAFVRTFGRDMQSFYTAFDEWRHELLPPAVIPRAFRSVRASDEGAPVEITALAESVATGQQITLLAQTTPGGSCKLRLRMADKKPALTHRTTADATGLLFWLVTIAKTATLGPATVTVDCGGDPGTAEIEIVSSWFG